MPATTVSITCDVSLPTALEFTSATFKFQLSEPDYDTTDNEVIATTEITAVANAGGVATVSLWPVTRGTRNSFYRVSLSAAVVVGGVPRWQDYTLGTIRPPATGAPHELADLLAQSSGGIIVGSTIYATLADAVAAAVAAVADAEAEVALAAAQVALASAQADRASDEADRAIADGAAQVALATAQANRAEDEADRAVDNAAAQVALASAQADRAEAAAAGYESLGNAIALAEAEVARAALEADRAELAADGVASLEAQAAASAAAAAVSAGIAVAAVESTTSEGATWRPEYYGATGVGNDTAALADWLASGGPLHVIKGKTYQFNAALTFPAGVKISGHLNLIWTGLGSVPIATINDDVSIDDLTISCPTTTGNGVTIGRNYKGRSIVINGFGNSGAGAVTISDPEGLDLDLFESTGGFQRPLTLGNGSVWSVGGRIGMVRVRDYTRGIGMNYLDGFTLEGYDIQGRNALASFTAGHNGIIAAGLRNCRFGPGIIANAGEHLFRLGGTAEMGASYNNTFGDMTLEAPGGCYIKLNANAIAYDFRFGDINAVGRFASVPGGNREFLRLSHCRDLTFGVCRLVVGDGFAYSAQDALALNDIDGVYVQALHVEGLGQSVVDYASGQDIGEGLGNGDVRNVSIGAVTGTDLTNRTMVRFSMATGFEAGSLTISSIDYFSDGPLFSASGTTVVDAPCSIGPGRFRKTDLSTLPSTTNLPANMAIDLVIGQTQVINQAGVLRWGDIAQDFVTPERFAGLSDTAAIQAAIDSLPSTGGEVRCASRVYLATGIRLDGSSGGKSNVTLHLPAGCIIRKPDHSALTTDAARKSNVIEALSGHGHKVSGEGRVEGNFTRGGLRPPYLSRHQLGSTWGAVGQIRSVAFDGTSSTAVGSATDDVYQVTALGAGQVSSAVNISFDVAAGYVVKVYDESTGVGAYNEATGAGYMNAWQVDTDFAFRHGIYMNGLTEAMQNPVVTGVTVTGAVFGGIMPGSGPLFADLIGFGTDFARIQNCIISSCGATLIGAGNKRKANITGNVLFDTDSTGIRLDENSHDCIVDGNTIDCNDVVNSNHGVAAYKSDRYVISNNWITNTAIGVSASENAVGTIVGNHIKSVGTGISLNGERCSIIGNRITDTTGDGIVLNGGSSHTVVGNSMDNIGVLAIDDTSSNSVVGMNAGAAGTTGIEYNNNKIMDWASGGTTYFLGEVGNHNFEVSAGGGTVINHIEVRGGANGTSNSPLVTVQGTTTDIDLRLLPKGAGRIRFGSFTSSTDVPIVGYVEIKDAAGTVRRLAVVS